MKYRSTVKAEDMPKKTTKKKLVGPLIWFGPSGRENDERLNGKKTEKFAF